MDGKARVVDGKSVTDDHVLADTANSALEATMAKLRTRLNTPRDEA